MSVGQGYAPGFEYLGQSPQQEGQSLISRSSGNEFSHSSKSGNFSSSLTTDSGVGSTSNGERSLNVALGYMDMKISPVIEKSPLPEVNTFEYCDSDKTVVVEPIMKDVELKAPEPPDDDIDSTGKIRDDLQFVPDQILVRKSEGLNFTVPVLINNHPTDAVVDSAAQVTVLSEELLAALPGEFKVIGKANLKGIGGPEVSIPAQKVDGVKIKLGSHTYPCTIFVAKVQDPLLLGLDFLIDKRCVVDFGNSEILLPNEKILASVKQNTTGGTFENFKVVAAKSTSFQPNSRTLLPVKVVAPSTDDSDFVMESKNNLDNLLIANCIIRKSGVVDVINDTDKFKSVKCNEEVGRAVLLVEVILPFEDPSVRSVSVGLSGNSAEVACKLLPALDSDTDLKSMPEHLKDLFERTCKDMSEEHLLSLSKLLIHYQDVFAQHDLDLGCLAEVKHKIDTKDSPPVCQRIRRTPLGFEGEEEKHLNKMLDAGVIRPSESEWASAPVLVRKKDGGVRWCIDFRALNERTVKDQYPLPLIEDCLDTLSGTMFFSTLDMASGYYQIPLDEDSIKKTAFITKYGLYEHTRMGFGLCNAPAMFQRAMNLVLRGLIWSEVLVYLDDIIVLGSNFEQHLESLQKVFERFRRYNLRLKPKKCELFCTQVEFLGRSVSNRGISITPGKSDAIKEWPVPRDRKELETFLGYMNYHRAHVKGYAGVTACLHELTKPKVVFVWEDKHQEAFLHLKSVLSTPPCLAFPQASGTFILDCDASDQAVGAELSQLQSKEERTIAYASFVLLPPQRRYCTTRKELLAVVRFCRYFRHYLLGKPFIVRSDHNSLAWLMRFKHIEGQLARWIEELAQYDFRILHRSGSKHSNADGLSRIPDTIKPCLCFEAGSDVSALPCGGCSYCKRAETQWSRFTNDVDDVLPLAMKKPEQLTCPDSEYVLRPAVLSASDSDQDETTEVSSEEDLEDTADRESSSDDDIERYNWTNKYSHKELRKLQSEDPDISPVIRWLEEGDPEQAELYITSPATKYWWLNRRQLQFDDGVLYYRRIEETDLQSYNCLVVPSSLHSEILEYGHDIKSSGHMGRDKTLNRLQRSFIWYQMAKDIMLYVKTCSTCNRNKKASKKAKARLGTYQAGFPMDRLHIDILGPFTESLDGNRYILMMYDQFSKWLECSALPEQSAELVADRLVTKFIATFGCPIEIHVCMNLLSQKLYLYGRTSIKKPFSI